MELRQLTANKFAVSCSETNSITIRFRLPSGIREQHSFVAGCKAEVCRFLLYIH